VKGKFSVQFALIFRRAGAVDTGKHSLLNLSIAAIVATHEAAFVLNKRQRSDFGFVPAHNIFSALESRFVFPNPAADFWRFILV
jgi:uncharacterized membrane protein